MSPTSQPGQRGGMTVTNVLGCGGQKGLTEEYVGTRTHVNLLPKLNIRVVLDAVRIRTRERGDAAI